MPSMTSRREFLKLMGASLGLAGMAGCVRWPEEELAPYAHRPANRLPGTSVVYPTAFEIGGIAQGVLAVSFDGRPIKIEGNPSHPLNRGAADTLAQASVLEVYDPERSRGVLRRQGEGHANSATEAATDSTWEEFFAWWKQHTPADGNGVCVLSEASNSPTLADLRARYTKAFPRAEWFEYEALSDDNAREGLRQATGKPLRQVLELEQADVIVALDADLFGGGHALAIKYSRDFAAGRTLDDAPRGPDAAAANPEGAPGKARSTAMNRLYVVEPMHTITGASADHRLAVRPSRIADVAAYLAAGLGVAGVEAKAEMEPAEAALLDQMAADLKAHAGRCVVAAGSRQPPRVHALVAAINQTLGNQGKTVVYYADPAAERPSHVAALRALVEKMNAGKVSTLLILGGNPVYDAPADLKFSEALAKVPAAVHLALHDDETSRQCDWHLSRAHYLEAWGDVRGHDGTVSVTQPLIQPLFDGRSAIEVLAVLAGDQEGVEGGGLAMVRRTLKALVGESFDEWTWKKSLGDGVVENTAWKPVEVGEARPGQVQESPAAGKTDAKQARSARQTCEVVFFSDGKVYDGRFANNAWLQEFPEPMTRLTWDNAALMAPQTAEALGLGPNQLVSLGTEGGEQVQFPVLHVPGMAEGVVALALGYGRTSAGSIGNGVGGNAYALRTSDALHWQSQARVITVSGAAASLATVQVHHVIDRVGREAIQDRIPLLIVSGTLEEYQRDPAVGVRKTGLPSIFNEHEFDGRGNRLASDEAPAQHQLHKWGMAIDLTRCTGCGACVMACQAENNIPIVGKEQVLLGREMHWLRVDRYYRETEAGVESLHEPIPCMHCKNAPCEEVCPVAATTHSQEGINMMTYNRCVGVRYCSNNCPYKVRRFNYFDYQRGTLKDLYVPNVLRKPESDLLAMQKNPDVTVRARGVMEKCTYCIQRIEQARIAARREGNRPLRDGEVQTACQQTCPAGAIVFGDLNDPESQVSKLHAQARAYGLLDDYLNTKPRTVYLARVRNK